MTDHSIILKIQLLPHHQDLTLPAYQSGEAAGMDPVSYTHLDVYKRQEYKRLVAHYQALPH